MSAQHNKQKKFKENLLALLQREVDEKGATAIAKQLGVKPSSVSRWLRGEIGLSFERLLLLLEKLAGVDIDTLLEAGQRKYTPPILEIQKTERSKKFAKDYAFDSYIPIPLLDGGVAAGPPSEVRERDILSWVLIYASKEWMPHDPEEYTCVYVRGLSMYPILADGDIVAIDHAEKDPKALDGKMTAFRVDGGVTIKWLKYDEKRRVVIGVPENHEYLDHIVTLKGEEIDEGIVGKVAWWWAKR